MNAEQLVAQEVEIAALWDAGELPYLTHLAGGNEQFLADFFHSNVRDDDWVLCSHRSHFHYALHGHTDLVEKVKQGKSMFLYGKRFICSAIVAGVASVAVGLAMAVKSKGSARRVFCFVGDGAADHGHFHEAIRATEAMGLPLTFIIEDNDSSCGVTKEQRGSPSEWQWPSCVVYHRYKMTWPHAGTGNKMTLKRITP